MKFLDHFSRVTSARRAFIPQIDGLRFIAVMAVLAFHIRAICSFHLAPTHDASADSDIVDQLFSVGHLGVSLFFSISGFILALPFAKQFIGGEKPVSLGKYYLRRVTRIEPPYIIHLVLIGLYVWIALRWQPSHVQLYGHDWFPFTSEHILASLVYLNGFIFANHPYPNIVLWSLEVEVQFYLIAPFLARLFQVPFPVLRRLVQAVLIVGLPYLIFGELGSGYRIGFSLLGNIQLFLVGFLFADLYVSKKIGTAGNWAWDLVIPAGIASVVFFRHWPTFGLFLPWIILLSFFAAFNGPASARILGLKVITIIGGMCYTIYMYHWLMISVLFRVTGRLRTHLLPVDLFIQFVLLSAAIIVACSVLFVLFERPFMRPEWTAEVRTVLLRLAGRKPQPS